MSRIIVTIAIFSALLAGQAAAHAGWASPIPFSGTPCRDIATCGFTTPPCGTAGLTNSQAPNVIAAGRNFTGTVYFAAVHVNPANTIELNYYTNSSSSATKCYTANQNGTQTTGNQTLTCTLGNAVLSSTGFIQVKFNATIGGGGIYYSCVGVTNQNNRNTPVAGARTPVAGTRTPVAGTPTPVARTPTRVGNAPVRIGAAASISVFALLTFALVALVAMLL